MPGTCRPAVKNIETADGNEQEHEIPKIWNSQEISGISDKSREVPVNFRGILENTGKSRKSQGFFGKYLGTPGIFTGPAYRRAGAQGYLAKTHVSLVFLAQEMF